MSLELMFAICIGVLAAAGVFLVLRSRTFDTVLGLTLVSYAVNLFIFAMGRLRVGAPPIAGTDSAASLASVADPLPQALVLTAIVIGFGMTALMLVIALRARDESGTDHVDGREPGNATETDSREGA